MSSSDSRLVEIARIGKVHGLDGTVRLHVDEDAETIIEKDVLLHLKTRRGDLIPARIIEFRVEIKRNSRLFFVKFDRIADRSEAEQFQDTPVLADTGLRPPKPDTDSIEGFEIVDETGAIGIVTGLMQNPAHPIIEAEIQSQYGTLLIPWVDEYVVSIDKKQKKVICQNLDQLINL
jgi:16S rRNA processing protein RimM